MNNTTEIGNIINELKKESCSKRQRTSLYLSEDLYKKFRIICGEVPPSKVIERLMRKMIEEDQHSA